MQTNKEKCRAYHGKETLLLQQFFNNTMNGEKILINNKASYLD